MKFTKVISLVNMGILLAVLLYLFFGLKGDQKVVVVDLGRVLEEYEMRKDLYMNAEVRLSDFKNTMDSLELIINKLPEGIQKKTLISEYNNVQNVAQSRIAQEENVIREKVSKRINPLFKKFGENKSCTVLLGITGSGEVLYGNENVDMTDELIKFINAKYEKG